jgi:hypothetical protein
MPTHKRCFFSMSGLNRLHSTPSRIVAFPNQESSTVYLRVLSFRIPATARSNFPELQSDGSTMKIPQSGHFISGLTQNGPMDRAFQAGQLHTTLEVPLDKVPSYRREHPNLIHLEPYAAVLFLSN